VVAATQRDLPKRAAVVPVPNERAFQMLSFGRNFAVAAGDDTA
jgi:hypothetical protein